MLINSVHVKVRDGQVTNQPMYAAFGVTVNGERDILGISSGDGGDGAKFLLAVLTDIKNRGVPEVWGGLEGLPDAIYTAWGPAVVETCLIHLLRNMFRFASRKYWDEMARDLRPVHTALSESAATEREKVSPRWAIRCKPALNAFAITSERRIIPDGS